MDNTAQDITTTPVIVHVRYKNWINLNIFRPFFIYGKKIIPFDLQVNYMKLANCAMSRSAHSNFFIRQIVPILP